MNPVDDTLNFQTELIDHMVYDLNNQKEQLIRGRLVELGILDYVESRKDYKFKPLVCEIMGCEETWWFDDDSRMGLRIITFIKPGLGDDTHTDFNTISYTLKYY